MTAVGHVEGLTRIQTPTTTSGFIKRTGCPTFTYFGLGIVAFTCSRRISFQVATFAKAIAERSSIGARTGVVRKNRLAAITRTSSGSRGRRIKHTARQGAAGIQGRRTSAAI